MKIRITKEFCFEASHALANYDGLCANIHGHSYRLFVTLMGTPNENTKSPKYGMIMDFADLKQTVQRQILDYFDHSLVLKDDSPFVNQFYSNNNKEKPYTKLVIVPYQPTCENLLADFVKRISDSLPAEVSLCKVQLNETATSFAEWFAEDNCQKK